MKTGIIEAQVMRIKIRTKSKTIRSDIKIYILRAGPDLIFYDDFIRQNKIFLTIPNTSPPSSSEINDELMSEFQKGHAWSQYLLNPRLDKPPASRSSFNPKSGLDISGFKAADGQNINAYFTFN